MKVAIVKRDFNAARAMQPATVGVAFGRMRSPHRPLQCTSGCMAAAVPGCPCKSPSSQELIVVAAVLNALCATSAYTRSGRRPLPFREQNSRRGAQQGRIKRSVPVPAD